MPQLPEYPQLPTTAPVDYGHLIAWPILGTCAGLFILFPVVAFLFCPFFCGGDSRANNDALLFNLPAFGAVVGFSIGALNVAFQFSQISDAKMDYRRRKAAYDAALAEQEREKEKRRAQYASAYAEYLPRWVAWQQSMQGPRQQAAALKAWQAMLPEYERRAKQAATALDRLYHTIDTRARVQLGLTSQTDILSIYYEAVSAASSTHLDFGLLRLPRWRGLVTLAPLDEVFSALPRVPNDILEEVAAPVFPLRPTPPKILVFASDFDIPLPVEQVRFS